MKNHGVARIGVHKNRLDESWRGLTGGHLRVATEDPSAENGFGGLGKGIDGDGLVGARSDAGFEETFVGEDPALEQVVAERRDHEGYCGK